MTRFAIAGNPNAGKSTLFNRLTGARARVGNYPGVTVERKEGRLTLADGRTVELLDLPGCYSLTARSPEEEVTHDVLMGRLGEATVDAVLCVVDASQLARGLYLLLQLLELQRPLVLVLTMLDTAKRQGLQLDLARLHSCLQVPVIAVQRGPDGLVPLLAQLAAPLPAIPPSPAYAGLNAGEWAAIASVQAIQSPGETHHSLGTALWLLTSDRACLERRWPADLLRACDNVRAELDAAEPVPFSRRLIAARYAVVDATVLVTISQAVGTDMAHGSQRLDRLLLHPIAGPLLLICLLFGLFQAVFSGAEPLMREIEGGLTWVARGVTSWVPPGLTQSLLLHGILAGVGNTLVFLPQIGLLFIGLALLEDSGYLARAAFLLDRLMRRVGLPGQAFIPLMTSFACAVPGIMATRTMASRQDRLTTMLIAPFMTCSARLPVYALIIAAVFSGMPPLFGWLAPGVLVLFAMYALGLAAALGTAWLLQRTLVPTRGGEMLMQLPAYQWPQPALVLRRAAERCWTFVCDSGTVILALSILLWALLSFPRLPPPPPGQAPSPTTRAAALEHSWGGRLGHAIEPAIAPLGFDWRIGIGLIASIAAREVMVTTLAQVYALDAEAEDQGPSLRLALQAARDPKTGRARFTPLRGLSLMVFFVLAMQCMSTVAVVRRETGSWAWPLGQWLYMNGLAYAAAWLVYQGGRALGWDA